MSGLPAGSSAGPGAVKYAAAHGLILDGWQAEILCGSLGEGVSGWAAKVIALIAPRRNGKNFAVYARELFGLGVLGEQIIHTAQLFKTTKESFYGLLEFIEQGPLGGLVKHRVASPGSGYTMWFANGGRIDFIARSATSGRGLNADLLVLDEAQDLSDDELGALVPTQAARPDPQAWYLGSAPAPSSEVWQRLRQRGRSGDAADLVYFEFSAEPGSSPDDEKMWRVANPALVCGRLNIDVIRSERLQMTDEMFLRERLSISPEMGEMVDRVFDLDQWRACFDGLSSAGDSVVFGVDVGPDRKLGSIGVASAVDGGVHVEIVDNGPGVAWVIPRLVELAERHSAVVVVDPSSPAGSLIPDLISMGVRVEPITRREVAQACGRFHDLVTTGQVRHLADNVLDVAAAGVVRRPIGDLWLFDRRSSSVDLTPLYAVALAVWGVRSGVVSVSSKPIFAF